MNTWPCTATAKAMLRISRIPSQAMACGSVTTGVRRAYSAEFATRITCPASAMSRWMSPASSAALVSACSPMTASPRVSRITSEATCGGGGNSSESVEMAAFRMRSTCSLAV